jgi:hypothetical protein
MTHWWSLTVMPRTPRYRGRHKMRARRQWVDRQIRENTIVWERLA